MSKRDIVGELVLLRKRNRQLKSSLPGSPVLMLAVLKENFGYMTALCRNLKSKRRVPKELLLLAPVRAVAGIQFYFQSQYADLIDRNVDCLRNCAKIKELRLGFDQLASLRQEGFTVGAFAAHFLQPNSWGDLKDTTDELTGVDFTQLLSDQIHKQKEAATMPEGAYWDAFNRNLTELFEIRHRICHEAVPPRHLNGNVCFDLLSASLQLLLSSKVVFEKLALRRKRK
jgi:hypothetical protein